MPDWVGYPIFFSILLILAAIAVPNLLRSRMAANESAAVAQCRTYCEAQDITHRTDWDGDGEREYAQTLKDFVPSIVSGHWHQDLELLTMADVDAEGPPGQAQPKHGYVFKVLTGQGAAAPGGAKTYVDADGNMTQGYALIACPTDYDKTGRNTFVVNMSGVVYQKDLGPDTVKLYLSTDAYDPDETWTVAE